MPFFPPPTFTGSLFGLGAPPGPRWHPGMPAPGMRPPPPGGGGFLAKLGLADPRVRSLIASQMLAAPSFRQSLGALAQGPALLHQFAGQDEQERLEEERRRQEEEDRELRRKIQEAQLARQKEEKKERERRRMAEITERRESEGRDEQFESLLGSLDPDVAQALRVLGPQEGTKRFLARKHPTTEEQKRQEILDAQLANYRSLTAKREREPASRAYEPRTYLNDQVRILGQQIDDARAMLPQLPEYGPGAQKRADLEAQIAAATAARETYRQKLDSFGQSATSDLPTSSLEGVDDAVMKIGGPGLVQDLKAAGIYESVRQRIEKLKSMNVPVTDETLRQIIASLQQ